MIDLDTCLKESGIIKKDIYIKTFEETDQIAKNVSMGELYNITFEKSSLKSRFFLILKERREYRDTGSADTGWVCFVDEVHVGE